MDVKLREGRRDDAETCGRTCFEAFSTIARGHTFPSDVPAREVGVGLVSMMLEHPHIYSVVAEVDGKVVGSNFLDERAAIVGGRRVHGHDRTGEMADAIAHATARVVEHDNRVTGYATDLAFFAHAVGENNEDLKALIQAAEAFAGSGILVPTTNGELFRWCLERGLHVVHVMTLMTTGLYTTPQGAYLPSVTF